METSYILAAIAAVTAQSYLSPIPEVSTTKVLTTYLLSNLSLLAYLLFTHTNPITNFLTLNAIFLSTATILTLIRRLYFSPLSRFPGPKYLALSNIFKAHIYFTGRGSSTILALHKRYGNIVRIGPNELSIIDVDAVEKVFKGKYPRGTFYEVGAINGEVNLNTVREYDLHTPWRRIWEKAFASKEFGNYNPRVESHVQKLSEVIRQTQGREVNVTKMMDNLVFDM